MKNVPVILFAATLFSLTACQKDPTPITASSAPLSSETILSWQECADFKEYDLSVCFSGANEYRCPCDVNCVWPGSVDYILTVRDAGSETTLTLQPPGNPGSAPSSGTVGKVTISISETSPIDCADYGNFERYKLNVVVSTESEAAEF